MRYFEDYELGLTARFGAYPVTREEVLDFASKYDPQAFHLDDAAAAANPIFGRIAASGWHTCAMAMRILVDEWMEDGHFSLGGNGADELRWLKPVYPGDTLSVQAEVLAKHEPRSKPTLGFIDYRLTVYNQHDEPVMTMRTTNMQPKRPAS